MIFKRGKVLYGLLAILMATVACSPTPDSKNANPESAPKKQILTLKLGGEPTVLNPVLSTDVSSSKVEGQIFNGLMKTDQDLNMVPDLALTFNVNETGEIYDFTLKERVLWHDGAPFTAEDVKFTFDRIMDPKTNTVRRGNFILNGNPIKFEVIGPYHIRATLPEAYAPFLTRMGTNIIPKHIYEAVDINTATANRHPIGTGPFMFETWKTGQFIRLKRNPNLKENAPKIDEIVYKVIPDERTALVALERHEIHATGIPYKDMARFKSHKDFNLFQYQDLHYTYFAFNLKHPLFADKRVREAMTHAVNKEALTQHILKGNGQAAHLPAAPISWAYPKDKSIKTLGYDPEKSKALLAEAGFVLNKDSGILEKNGKPFSFTLITNQGNKDREKTAQILQRFFKEIGIEMKIQLMEWAAFLKIVNAPEDPKNYDAVILGWSLGLDPDGSAIWHSKEYPKGFNFIGYKNPNVDRLLDAGRTAINKEKRKAIYAELYAHIADDLPYIFLYYPDVVVGVNKQVKGLSAPGPAGLMNPIEEVYLDATYR